MELDARSAASLEGPGKIRLSAGAAVFELAQALQVDLPQGALRLSQGRAMVRCTAGRSLCLVLAGSADIVTSGGARQHLGEGQSAWFSATQIDTVQTDQAYTAAWQDGQLEVHDQPLQTVVDALAAYRPGWLRLSPQAARLRVTGLTTRQIGGGERTQFFSRGFEINSFLADGVPMAYDYDTQGVATLAMYDHIEVLRGAAGMMTGAGNPSGTINVVRKRPTRTAQFSVTASAGSWDNYRGEIDASGPLNESGTVRARGVVAYQDANTFKKASEHQRQLYYGTIEADISANTTVSIGGYYNLEDNPGADWNGLPTRRDGSFYRFKRPTRLSPDWAYWNKANTSFFAEMVYPWSRQGYQRQVSGYATTRLSLADPLTLMLGARLDWYEYDMMLKSGDYVSPPADYKVNHQLTPYAGLVYELDNHHSVYSSWTSVFQPQGSQASNGTPLDPVVGTNLEAGIKGEYFDGRLNASAAVFQIRQRNRPVALPPSECNAGVPECYAPSGKVQSRGFELEVAGAITPAWQVSAGYTFNRSKYLEDSGTLPAGAPYDTQTPRHLFKLSTMYTLPGSLNAWRIGAAVRVQSAISQPAYRVRQPGYRIWDAVLAYRASRHLDLRLNVYILSLKQKQGGGEAQDGPRRHPRAASAAPSAVAGSLSRRPL